MCSKYSKLTWVRCANINKIIFKLLCGLWTKEDPPTSFDQFNNYAQQTFVAIGTITYLNLDLKGI